MQDREAWIYSKQVYTLYPFQGASTALPRGDPGVLSARSRHSSQLQPPTETTTQGGDD